MWNLNFLFGNVFGKKKYKTQIEEKKNIFIIKKNKDNFLYSFIRWYNRVGFE